MQVTKLQFQRAVGDLTCVQASWGQRAERARQCSWAPPVTFGCSSADHQPQQPDTRGHQSSVLWKRHGVPAVRRWLARTARVCSSPLLLPQTWTQESVRKKNAREYFWTTVCVKGMNKKSESSRPPPATPRCLGTLKTWPQVTTRMTEQTRRRNLADTDLEVSDAWNEGSTRPVPRGQWASQASCLQVLTLVADTSMQHVCLSIPKAAF